MRTVALLAVALLALAGCSSKSGPDNYTCQKTGRVIDLSTVEGSGKKGFDPESACPAPIPPSVSFSRLPAGMTAYFPAVATWAVSPGNYTSGHSMLTQLMWSGHPMATDKLQGPATFSANAPLAMYAHQDVPAKFDGKIKFEKPGTYYLRAYAQVRGDGLPDTDYWSPEIKLTVNAVNASGKSTEVTHEQGPGLGGQVGKFGPTTVSAALGDAIVLVNKDVVEHKFTFSGVCKNDDVTVGAGAKSDPILMVVPGSCTIKTDDAAGAQQSNINVAEPV
jgi:plastocyanin